MLRNKMGRGPCGEQIAKLTLLARVLYKAVLGVHYKRQEQKAAGQLPVRPTIRIGYARVSTSERTLSMRPLWLNLMYSSDQSVQLTPRYHLSKLRCNSWRAP